MTVGQGEEIISLLKDIRARAMSILISMFIANVLLISVGTWLTIQAL